ncbi:MAG TPA: hypothetical protein VLE97_08830 [Gaiellaceae bacterium]|nr:hypothetical protein [Gaiellaceae bacterium]
MTKQRTRSKGALASNEHVTWLVVCSRCDKPKAPRGCVPADDSEAKDYCMRDCPGYETWPYPTRLPKQQIGARS